MLLTLGFEGICTFTHDGCHWENMYDNDFDWTRNRACTPTNNTGPCVDHTSNSSSGNEWFLVINSINMMSIHTVPLACTAALHAPDVLHLQLHARNMHTVRHYKKLRVNHCTYAIFLLHVPNYKHWSWKRVLFPRTTCAWHAWGCCSTRKQYCVW